MRPCVELCALLAIAAAPALAADRSPACSETRFPAQTGQSLRTVLADLSRADHFDVYYWTDQDAPASHAAGSSTELVDQLSTRFNLIVEYRQRPHCAGQLQVARLWVLAAGLAPTTAASAPVQAPPKPSPPDPAILDFLRAHGAKPAADGHLKPPTAAR